MESKYVITYAHYYDCPVCVGTSADDPEFCYISGTLDDLKEIVDYVKAEIGVHFLKLYKMESYGELVFVSDFKMHNGGHRTHGASFEFEGHTYTVRHDSITSTNQNFNILYGK